MSLPGDTDDGMVAGVEGVIFGVLVFVVGTLLIVNAWGVIDAKIAAGSAAREATRAFVESNAPDRSGALAEAARAATETIEGLGRSPERMDVIVESAELVRCARVTIRVDYRVPVIVVPLLGRHGTGFTASARHSEVIDPFRSGLAAATACPPELRG